MKDTVKPLHNGFRVWLRLLARLHLASTNQIDVNQKHHRPIQFFRVYWRRSRLALVMFSILDAPPTRKYQLDAHPKSCRRTYNVLDRLKALHDGVGCRFWFSACLQVAKTSLMRATELRRSIEHFWIYLRRSKMVLESIVRSYCASKRQMPKQMRTNKKLYWPMQFWDILQTL